MLIGYVTSALSEVRMCVAPQTEAKAVFASSIATLKQKLAREEVP